MADLSDISRRKTRERKERESGGRTGKAKNAVSGNFDSVLALLGCLPMGRRLYGEREGNIEI